MPWEPPNPKCVRQSGSRPCVMSAGRNIILLAALAVLLASSTVTAQSLSQSITNQSSATITDMGYNETGFMNTSEVKLFRRCLGDHL